MARFRYWQSNRSLHRDHRSEDLFENAPFEQFTQNTLIQEKELLDEFISDPCRGVCARQGRTFSGHALYRRANLQPVNQVVAGISSQGRLHGWMIDRSRRLANPEIRARNLEAIGCNGRQLEKNRLPLAPTR